MSINYSTLLSQFSKNEPRGIIFIISAVVFIEKFQIQCFSKCSSQFQFRNVQETQLTRFTLGAGIAQSVWLRDTRPREGQEFPLSTSSRPAVVSTQPHIKWVYWEGAAHHSPPTSAEVKKLWIYTSTPPYAFMA
jgi:hypothetical protein